MFQLHCLATSSSSSVAVAADDAQREFFEKKIRPVFVQHCYECHAPNAKKLRGGLRLDSREGLRVGGDSGTAIVPGKPDESLLIKAVRYSDDDVKMPPKGKLPEAAIADLEEWIRQGAFDPRDIPLPVNESESWENTLRERARWWSLQPVQKPVIPQTGQNAWSDHPVDRFILTRLEQQGLVPADAADPRTLARRLSIVLTGLPPQREIVDKFLERWMRASGKGEERSEGGGNKNPEIEQRRVVEGFVDSLLESPHFGERWARHWMDVVRFTETHGNEWNYEVHHAWQYRDYLIRAFNADVPYDQFVREHIAGDLLSPPRWNNTKHFNESVIGTGFYRFGEVNHDDCISLRTLGFDIADNQIDTLTKAFQATTVACARCHNHKLDAVSMNDYYGLLGILRNSRMVSHCIDASQVNADLLQRMSELKSHLRKELAAVWVEDAAQLSKYLLAATAKRAKQAIADDLAKGLDGKRLEKWVAALSAEKTPLEDVLEPWRLLIAKNEPATFASDWQKVAERYATEGRERGSFNEKHCEMYADFRGVKGPKGHPGVFFGSPAGHHSAANPKKTPGCPPGPVTWQRAGQGLRDECGRSGDFVLYPAGEIAVRAILPAGCFTHSLSDKLNGTLRSAVLPVGKKNISFQVMGMRSSAVRLVSNNCQLNYKNYRALISSDLHWETFAPPEDRVDLRTYAELMTMFDNPKFPDQLATLGGDTENYRMPWEKAAQNPRSFFGVTRVVLHDGADPPKSELTHFQPVFAGAAPASLAPISLAPISLAPTSLDEVADRYGSIVAAAVQTFANNEATDDDVRWLDALRQRELLTNQVSSSPRWTEIINEYRQLESQLALPRVIAGIAESGGHFPQPVFIRGDCTRPGEMALQEFLDVFTAASDPFGTNGSGRLELANRLVDPRNPLTARVMVNRLWHHLFGFGIVRTVDDFGHVGELPSHPELLDHLAAQLMAEGWSVKKLIRSLVLSKTFQMASVPSSAAREIDPRNQFLQHYPARRMEAEAIRDSILLVAGSLDRNLFGPSVQPSREKDYADRRLFAGPIDGHGRRSLYIKNNLMERPKFLETFNFPGGKLTQGRRDVTNVPAQALALLNDPFVLQQADGWSKRLITRSADSTSTRIDHMFQTALNRPPTASERERFEQTAAELARIHQIPSAELLTSQLVWRDLGHAMFNLQEFIYVP